MLRPHSKQLLRFSFCFCLQLSKLEVLFEMAADGGFSPGLSVSTLHLRILACVNSSWVPWALCLYRFGQGDSQQRLEGGKKGELGYLLFCYSTCEEALDYCYQHHIWGFIQLCCDNPFHCIMSINFQIHKTLNSEIIFIFS